MVDAPERRLLRAGREISLEPKAFAALLLLVQRCGELVTREQLLDSVWGHRYVTPATLNRIIVLLRRALADDASEPRFIVTVHGVGYRYVGKVERSEATPSGPKASFEPPFGARLPAQLDTLIGRDAELEQLRILLLDNRAVTIVGAGGMGKTHCGLELARQVASAFVDGVWFLDLAPYATLDEWLKEFAALLSIPAMAASKTQRQLSEAFRDRSALLLFDNCERFAPDLGSLIVELLRTSAELRVLATSQRNLNFVGEQVMALPPLACPELSGGEDAESLMRITASPAVALLVSRARAIQPAFIVSQANASAVVSICRQLDGMPLALELVAARLAVLSPDEILARLEHRFQLLTGNVSGRPPRHQTLTALLDWSYGLLSAAEQQMLCALAVFQEGSTVQGAEAVGAALGFDGQRVLALLGGLANKSLIRIDPTIMPSRHGLLESVRAFALEQLATSDFEAAVRNAHLAQMVSLAECSRKEILHPRTPGWNLRMLREHANIDAALEWAKSPAGMNQDAALHLAGSLMLYTKCHGEYLRGALWCQKALEGTDSIESVHRGQALLGLGVQHFYLQTSLAQPALLAAARVAKQVGDYWSYGYASAYYACYLALENRCDQAAEQIQIVIEVAERLNDEVLRGLVALTRGFVKLAKREPAEAIVELASGMGLGPDRHQHHFLQMYIGLAHFGEGDLAEAADIWQAAMAASIELRNLRAAAGCLEGAAYIDIRRGNAEVGAWRLGAADAIRERSQLPLFRFWRPHHQDALSRARQVLGEPSYRELFSQGARSRFEIAINQAYLALRGHAQHSARGRERGPLVAGEFST